MRYEDVKKGFDRVERVNFVGIRLNPIVDLSRTFEIILEEGESFESLAYKYYGDSNLWWVIADQNGLQHPLYLLAGSRIKILKKQFLRSPEVEARY